MNPKENKGLKYLLYALFIVAVTMGTGPGVLLINDPVNVRTVFGVPILYAWVVFWYLVMTAIIIAAYRTIWRESPDP
ncbi:MAG: hypothetical protein Q4G68_02545 [Planctomycetia bacterium]|nr:hypothetical protein [Planctomycetia bacterium]